MPSSAENAVHLNFWLQLHSIVINERYTVPENYLQRSRKEADFSIGQNFGWLAGIARIWQQFVSYCLAANFHVLFLQCVEELNLNFRGRSQSLKEAAKITLCSGRGIVYSLLPTGLSWYSVWCTGTWCCRRVAVEIFFLEKISLYLHIFQYLSSLINIFSNRRQKINISFVLHKFWQHQHF